MYFLYLTIFLFILFLGYKVHLSKLKKSILHSASTIKNKKTIYYIAYQKRHGVYARMNKLSKQYVYFVSKEIILLMQSTYNTAEEAEASLVLLQEKLNAL